MACLWAVYRISTHKIEYSFLDFFQLLSPLLGVVVFRKWWKAILNSHPKGENRTLSPQRCWDRSGAESRTPWWWCWSVRVLRTGTRKIFLLLLLEKYLLRQRAVNIPRYSSIFGTKSSSFTERMYRAGFNHHSSPGEDFLATQRPGVNRGRERVDCFCYLFSRCWCRRRGKECQNKTGMPLTDGVDWWRRVFKKFVFVALPKRNVFCLLIGPFDKVTLHGRYHRRVVKDPFRPSRCRLHRRNVPSADRWGIFSSPSARWARVCRNATRYAISNTKMYFICKNCGVETWRSIKSNLEVDDSSGMPLSCGTHNHVRCWQIYRISWSKQSVDLAGNEYLYVQSRRGEEEGGHGRSTRHKRQHRGGGRASFILTDFVGVPDPEADVISLQSTLESGIWSEWSDLSECSRTCGGGVSTQTRECLQRG